ncbi:disulfide bond formation protein DsbA [Mesorhizobium sp. SARCC-RB16n]|uniref:DsbA family protein n=1 Tax=Mesorhizobium sp. SARCC-RB16n TaxID=2116687 RepID=UPI00122F4CA4|nr:DsbA family protein [Mesorhizobium sp. SARCC-RB16n]KAA3441907.1 disulfide bond formation protein DsbA [Mesorhizobium sp. SARCC-RB16n]
MPEPRAGYIALLILALLLTGLAVQSHPPGIGHLREDRRLLEADWRKLIPERRDALFNDPSAPTAGNPNGDVPLVVFLDYNCPHCRAGDPIIQQALKNDPKLKVVYKEFPSKAPGSKFAAVAALASRKQGKYESFHHALMAARGQVSEFSILTIARQVGLDVEKLRRDMEDPAIEDTLKRNRTLATDLYITGTPALVLGDEVIEGVPQIPTLERLIAKARQKLSVDTAPDHHFAFF